MSCADTEGEGHLQHVHPLKSWYWLRSLDFEVGELWYLTTTWLKLMLLMYPVMEIQNFFSLSLCLSKGHRDILPHWIKLAGFLGGCKRRA